MELRYLSFEEIDQLTELLSRDIDIDLVNKLKLNTLTICNESILPTMAESKLYQTLRDIVSPFKKHKP